jgi:hypothetical protein
LLQKSARQQQTSAVCSRVVLQTNFQSIFLQFL